MKYVNIGHWTPEKSSNNVQLNDTLEQVTLQRCGMIDTMRGVVQHHATDYIILDYTRDFMVCILQGAG